jgi:hypothetical protein
MITSSIVSDLKHKHLFSQSKGSTVIWLSFCWALLGFCVYNYSKYKYSIYHMLHILNIHPSSLLTHIYAVHEYLCYILSPGYTSQGRSSCTRLKLNKASTFKKNVMSTDVSLAKPKCVQTQHQWGREVKAHGERRRGKYLLNNTTKYHTINLSYV